MVKSMTRIGTAVGAAILTVGLGHAALSIAGGQNQAPAADGGRGGPGFGGRGRGGPFDFAQGRPMGPLAGLPLRELNLSESQRQQVRTIIEPRESEMRAVGERAIVAREALQAAMTSPSLDEGLVRQRAAELSAIEADLAVTRARIYADVFQILTPEQQAKAKEISGSRPRRPNAPR
jgi:protein CpxP